MQTKHLSISLAIVVVTFQVLLVTVNQANGGPSTKLFVHFLEKEVPKLLGQKANDETGDSEKFREFVTTDHTNDDITERFTSQDIIARSGFGFENHYVTSKDGYITQLIRIINPLADRRRLKQPPVMLLHGGNIDPSTFIWASAIQHVPERYPRTAEDGPMKSWNRSMGFMLANNGYDVWLVGTRGCNSQNLGHRFLNRAVRIFEDEDEEELQRLSKFTSILRPMHYWHYSIDEIIEHELPKQMEKILAVTGAKKLNILGYSLGTVSTLSLFSSNRHYGQLVNSLVLMAPMLNAKGSNRFLKTLYKLGKFVPDELGNLLLSEVLFNIATRHIALLMNHPMGLRYTLIKTMMSSLCGPSPKYQTFLEPAVVGNFLHKVAFSELKHAAQQMDAGRLQKYDHGAVGNLRRYGSIHPPAYNLTKLYVDNWAIISGANDAIAPKTAVDQLLKTVKSPKISAHIYHPIYNHLDLSAAVDNDIYINLPLLKYFDEHQLEPLGLEEDSGEISNRIHESIRPMRNETFA